MIWDIISGVSSLVPSVRLVKGAVCFWVVINIVSAYLRGWWERLNYLV